MAKLRCVVSYNVKAGADPGTLSLLRKFLIEDFVPAQREAPGLISIEVDEKYIEPVPQEGVDEASDLAFLELWVSPESHLDWWTGDNSSPRSDRLKAAMRKMDSIMQSPQGQYIESVDYHYTVVE